MHWLPAPIVNRHTNGDVGGEEMTEPEIDYISLFRALPGSAVLLTPELVYADANEEFLRRTGRTPSKWSAATCPTTPPATRTTPRGRHTQH